MRTWIHQRLSTNCCGQIAVAVIARISLDEAIKVVGKKGTTKTKDLVKALRKLGFKCPDRCVRKNWHETRPTLAIGQLHDKKRRSGWHWVVIEGVKVYDGIYGDSDGTAQWTSNCKITSYLPVCEKRTVSV